ncbi:MAG: polyketide synthase dehydratase domain-containing protein [Gemmataceae bacterium]
MVAAKTVPAIRPAATPASGWDTEVFVLRGHDREHLRGRVLALAAFLESNPSVALADLAFSLASHLLTGGTRLALVSGSSADLVKKLNRAAERLADPNAKQLRDGGGVYWFSEPLAEKGTVAFLYPGEGAQYLDMLADLCRVFPEVERAFAWCDELADAAGRPHESLRRILHLPADAGAEERAAAEAELRKLGPSIFGVLVADLAMTDLLRNLGVQASAVAGHSAGELAALLAAGILRSTEETGPKLVETMDLMQRLEEESGGPDVALLAVGAGKPAVVEIEATLHTENVHIAMDNCPHQCVAVGPSSEIAAIEKALAERGTICERLPFRRPYHTPLFEQWMPPLRDLFTQIPFDPGHTPAYCCSTGERFPADEPGLRALTVNHWVNPVEFTGMVRRMHADGVRLFVEAGPRGNLSAFVEDILRGETFAAIPANTTRKSGPTQINHLVAQLAAHNVPLNLGHLYAERETRMVHWEGEAPAEPSWQLSRSNGSAEASPSHLPPGAMQDYFAVMEQFLDVQREVMEAYLSGVPQHAGVFATATGLEQRKHASASPCLLGEVLEFVPHQSIVFRRTMDLREDLYVDDHTLGGRGVSRVNPNQNGLPVLPMTFSLEAMATAATQIVPGKVVVAIRNVRLYRWLPFDLEPTTLEVRASVASVDPETGEVIVKANVRDLGNSFLANGAEKPSSEAIVVLADRFPEPPPALPFELTNEVRCKSSVQDLRNNMFHGPVFQMIRALDRTGDEGIEGLLEVQSRDTWFATNKDPVTVIDPVLVDAAMHILGAWHLEQPDWSGRILLPIGVKDLEFYGPIPAPGTMMLVRGHNEEETARQARHGVELFHPDGRLWFRMTGAAYWRFYLPFGDVNFFGPKDQYFLSHRFEAAEPSADARCYKLEPPLDLQQPVLRASGVCVTMTPREIDEHMRLTGTDAEKSDWFFGRLVTKDAVRGAVFMKYGTPLFPADIEAEPGEPGRYVCTPRANHFDQPYPNTAFAIGGGLVAAFSAFTPKLGIAIVPLGKNPSEADVAAAQADALKQASAQAGGGKLKTRTVREKNVVVATAIGGVS